MNKMTMRLVVMTLIATGVYAENESEPADTPAQLLYGAESQRSFTGPEKWFTGDVNIRMVFPGNDTAHYSGAYVTFQPGARTAWHLHPAGQHIIVTDGVCLTGTRDGRVVRCKTGEAVWCPPDIDHWHGAMPDRAMTHLVITGSRDGQNVVWKEHVTDEQYLGDSPKKAENSAMDINEFLSRKQQAMVPVAAFAASGDLEKLKPAIAEGLEAGLTVNEIKEILVHLYAYAGFPRSLNALGTFMEVLEERKSAGITDAIGVEAGALPDGTDPLELGTKVQTELAGRKVAGPLFDFAPVINEYLRSHLFGDLFGRDVLDYQSREIVTVSALSNMEGVAPQFRAHLGIALNTGLTEKQLQALAAVFESRVGEPRYSFAQP